MGRHGELRATRPIPVTANERASLAVCVDVLGPLSLRVAGEEVEVPGARRRALLALLALAAGRIVGAERLAECLWPDDPPDNAVQALYNHVSRLRGHLGDCADRLQRQGAGYRLHLLPYELDVDAARRLARAAAEPGTPPVSVVTLAKEALDLWRGPALEEFRSLPVLESESVALDELRLQLVDDLLTARLAVGDRSVTVEAAAAAAASPLRERTTLLHVRALAVDGRQAESMAAARAYRRRLADETGLDPGSELAELEQLVATGTLAQAGTAGAAGGPARVVARPDGPLIGRQHDRQEVLRLLATNAFVTITGPGGVGKTRLALEVAADPSAAPSASADVVVVDLAAVDRPERLCQAVSSTLGLRTTGEVRPGDVARELAGRDLLLVLDNCEHLADACRDLVVTVRGSAPGVRVLATSRLTLHVPGEYAVRLQPLPVPRDARDLDSLRRQSGVRAFVEHARRRRADFELDDDDAGDLVEVLRRLDGLPLGIELAARQVAVMPVRAIRERLDRALDLSIARPGSDHDRQRTLRASIDSSYRLLDEDERRLLQAIAPFAGGVDLASIEVLAQQLGSSEDPLDLLLRLVDSSLVVADPSTGRYGLLFTVRAFLLDQLRTDGELSAAEERFLDRCLAVAREIGEQVLGPDEPVADRRLRAELDNLRAARDVALAHDRDDVRVGITLALSEAATWRDLRELWAWALELVTDPDLLDHPERVALLAWAAEAARHGGDLQRADELAQQAMAAAGPDPSPGDVALAWMAVASVAHFRGDFALARQGWLRANDGRPVESGALLGAAALAAAYGGDPQSARALLDRAHACAERSGCRSQAAFAAYVHGEIVARTNLEEAVSLYLRAIDDAGRVGATFVEGVARVALASARTRMHDVPGAAEGFGYLIGFWRETGQSTQLWTTVRNAAGLLATVGRERTAALLLLAADAAPEAAAVGPQIARFSGRTFTPVAELVPPADLVELRAELDRIGTGAVLDRAVGELGELVGHAEHPTSG